MSAGKLRVGLVGAGMISFHHLVAWSRARGAAVTAICDRDPARAASRAREFGIDAAFDDAEAMLATGRIDAIDVAAPPDSHAALVRLAAARGVPILCQKPLTPDFASAAALVAEARGRARLMVHENWRFRPQYRRAREWLDEGRVGRVQQATLAVESSGLLPDAEGDAPALRREPGLADLPRLLVGSVLIHHLDVARWLLGPLRVVASRTLRAVATVRGETAATILLETATGAPVVVAGNLAVPGAPPRPLDRLAIVGDRGAIRFEGDRLTLSGPAPETVAFDLDAAYQESFDATIRHFAECLASGAEFETGGEDNLETLRLVEDAYARAR